MKRRWHHLRAVLGGYFWHPCPVCGRMFGGHEVSDASGELLDGNGFGSITCPECPGSWARGEDGKPHRLNVVYSDDPLNPTRVVMGRPK